MIFGVVFPIHWNDNVWYCVTHVILNMYLNSFYEKSYRSVLVSMISLEICIHMGYLLEGIGLDKTLQKVLFTPWLTLLEYKANVTSTRWIMLPQTMTNYIIKFIPNNYPSNPLLTSILIQMQLYFSSSWERGKRGSLITTFNQAVSSHCWSAMPILNYYKLHIFYNTIF